MGEILSSMLQQHLRYRIGINRKYVNKGKPGINQNVYTDLHLTTNQVKLCTYKYSLVVFD